jgi:hypothetical protein
MLAGNWKVKGTDELLRITGDSENKNFWIHVPASELNNISFNFMRSMYKHDGILRGKLFVGESVSLFEKNVIYLLEVKIDESINVIDDDGKIVMTLDWVSTG